MPRTASTVDSRRQPASRPVLARALGVLSAVLFAVGGALAHSALTEPSGPAVPAQRPVQPAAPAGGAGWAA